MNELIDEQKYVKIIENSLNGLTKEEADILISKYVEEKFWTDFSYSYSTYYKKLKKAEKKFLKFLS